jgi:hypothetical protein
MELGRRYSLDGRTVILRGVDPIGVRSGRVYLENAESHEEFTCSASTFKRRARPAPTKAGTNS